MQTKVGLVVIALLASPAWADKPAPKPKPEAKVRVNLPVIEVLDPSGTMTPPFVRAAIMKVEPELLKCAASTKWQNTALVWLVTDWRGKVTKLELAVDSPAIEKCIAPVLKTIVVQQSQVRTTTFVKLWVAVPPSDDPMKTLE